MPCDLPTCTMGVGDEVGGRWMTPGTLTTNDQALTALDRHLRAHDIYLREQAAQQDPIQAAAKSRPPK